MPRSTTLCAALAALFLLPMLTAPTHAQQSIPPILIATDIAVTEMAARRPLSAAERQQVIAINQAQFQREPAWQLKNLRGEVKTLQIVRRMDPVRLAEWRKICVVGDSFPTDAHVTPEEDKAYLAIYTRTNPIVDADPTTKTVICERDIDAWLAASRLMAKAGGVPAATRSSLVSDARNPRFSGDARIKAANMERNWTAYQLCWTHEPARDRQESFNALIGRVHQGAAKGKGTGSASGTALALAADAYGDYPYSLDPHFAAEKGAIIVMLMQIGRKNVETMHSTNGYVPGNP